MQKKKKKKKKKKEDEVKEKKREQKSDLRVLLNHLNLLTIQSPHSTCTILAHSDYQLRELREGGIKSQQFMCY
jgi:hypothetical protein